MMRTRFDMAHTLKDFAERERNADCTYVNQPYALMAIGIEITT